MERNYRSECAYSVDDRRLPHWPLQSDKSGCKAAFALTKEALALMALLSSLGVWAAVWAAAASMASAWLQ